jgi:RecB family exonuclease
MLARHGVPVVQRTDQVSLWQQAPVRALIDLLTISADSDAATPELVVDLLLGPLGRLDPARLGALRRALLVAEGRDGRRRRPDEVIRDAVVGAGDTPPEVSDPAVASLATVVENGRAAAADGSVEQALWALWSSCGLASQWRSAALSGTRDAAAADCDLDAVVALFEAAARFTDRLPGAGPAAFLDHVRAQQLPGDSWATSSPLGDAVSVLTAHATKGREWNTVAVCRVQEDLWPDLRRRQSLLGTDDLVTVLESGRLPSPAEQSSRLLAAERRLFHLAVTRAWEVALVTAVDDGEVRPSRLLDELDPEHGERVVTVAADPISLPALVAELRAAVCDKAAPGADRAEAARLLAVLADADVAGAHPDHWYGLAPLSDEAPIFAGDEPVVLSPSQIEGYVRCPLRWLLQRAGGDNGTALRQSIGTLVHDLAFEAARNDWSAEQVWARYDEYWAGIDAGRGWVARRERARVDGMVSRLVQWMARNRVGCAGVEIEVVAEVGGATVKGRLDRLQHEGGGLLVVDFKTGTTAPTKADVAENPQLGVYQWAVGAGAVDVGTDGPGGPDKPRPAGGVLVHLGIPNTDVAKELRQPALGDADDPQWPARLVRQVAEGVAQPTFAALVNSGCGHCPVRSSCPAHADGGRVVP